MLRLLIGGPYDKLMLEFSTLSSLIMAKGQTGFYQGSQWTPIQRVDDAAVDKAKALGYPVVVERLLAP